MTMNVQAQGIEMTDAINTYVRDKMATLEKFFDGIVSINVEVGMDSHHHQKGDVYFAKATIHVPGHDLHMRKDEQDLYKAIDKVKDHLKNELEKVKNKMNQIDREALRAQKAYQA